MMKKNSINKTTLFRNLAIIFFVVVLLLVVFIPRINRTEQGKLPEPHYQRINGMVFLPEGSPIREKILVENVGVETISMTISAPAKVEADPAKRANILPPTGGRVVRLFASMGQNISAGQPLFELYSPEIAEVQTGYLAASSALAQSERHLRRKEELHREGIAPLKEVEEARTEFEIARSEKEGALLKMRILGLPEEDLGKPLMVRSPIRGRLVDLAIAPGEFITEPDKPVMMVADLSDVWVTAGIQEKDIRFISTGTKVTSAFPAYPGLILSGEVLFVGDILDEDTRTTHVRIAFPNHDFKLKPGMFASVTFHTEPGPSIVLPPHAILQRRDYNYVYVEKSPFTFEKRQIISGGMAGDKTVIVSGLNEGERVITHNAILLP